MTCAEAEPLLHACLDGELDLRGSLGVEEHLASCDGCSAAYRKLEMLRAEIAGADLDSVPDGALERVRAAVERQAGLAQRTGWRTPWRAPAFLAATAAALVLMLFIPGRFAAGPSSTDREIVDSHLRSLLADHLLDVPSSNRHTVKPWFQGKLEFSPTVPDLAAAGFVLAGGRLDVIDMHKAAVLVYRRREHVINLWIWQGTAALMEPEVGNAGGFNLMRWSKNGMTYRAVSDLNVDELRTFANAIRVQ